MCLAQRLPPGGDPRFIGILREQLATVKLERHVIVRQLPGLARVGDRRLEGVDVHLHLAARIQRQHVVPQREHDRSVSAGRFQRPPSNVQRLVEVVRRRLGRPLGPQQFGGPFAMDSMLGREREQLHQALGLTQAPRAFGYDLVADANGKRAKQPYLHGLAHFLSPTLREHVRGSSGTGACCGPVLSCVRVVGRPARSLRSGARDFAVGEGSCWRVAQIARARPAHAWRLWRRRPRDAVARAALLVASPATAGMVMGSPPTRTADRACCATAARASQREIALPLRRRLANAGGSSTRLPTLGAGRQPLRTLDASRVRVDSECRLGAGGPRPAACRLESPRAYRVVLVEHARVARARRSDPGLAALSAPLRVEGSSRTRSRAARRGRVPRSGADRADPARR